jgi:hypothetical protein
VTRRSRPGRLCGLFFGVLLGVLAGCGPARSGAPVTSSPRPVISASRSASPLPSLPLPSPPPVVLPASPATSSSPTFAEGYAVVCNGYPSVSKVVSLLRRKQVIGAGANPTALVGPLCAGGWQYTVLSESGREPLQVVTQGTPNALTLVTAGTDVCTPMVRTQAPSGIQSVAHC